MTNLKKFLAQQHAVPNPHQKHLPIWHQTLQQQPQQQPQQIVPIHHQNQVLKPKNRFFRYIIYIILN